MVARAQILSSALQTSTSLPAFPAPSAVLSQASPFWDGGGGNSYLTYTAGVTDPLGGSNATRFVSYSDSPTACSRHSLGGFESTQPTSATYGSSPITASCFIRRVGTTGRYARFNLFGAALGSDAGCMFDLQTGTVGAYRSGGVTESGSGITAYDNGWYQIWFTMPVASTGNDIASHQIGVCSVECADGNFDTNGSVVALGDGFELFRYQIVSGTNPNG